MSRRRYLSTDVSLDLRVNRLAAAGDFAVMLYTWMIPHAADDASLPADPEEIMYMVIPGRRDKTIEDVAAALGAMRDCGLIIWRDGELRFPAAAFYRYQTYIKEGNRRGANQQETPQDSDSSANQRKSAQNAVSPSLSPPVKPSLSHSPPEEETRERAAATPPTPEPVIRVVASLSEITDDTPYLMVAMLCGENGKAVDAMPADWRGMQLAIAKRLLLNHSIEQVRAYVRYRKTAWNGNEPFDLRKVEKDIGAWELAGRPVSEPARASPGRSNGTHRLEPLEITKLNASAQGLAEWNAQMDAEEMAHGTAHLQSANGADEHRLRPGADARAGVNVLGPGEEPPRRPLRENGRSAH